MGRREQRKRTSKTRLEQMYAEFFIFMGPLQPVSEADTLEQPSPLRYVPSVTTYSAYEDPVIAD